MKLTEAKLFPHLDDTPDSHKLRLVHSVTQYDRQNEARAERKGQKHNIYALGHYLAAADRVHDDLKAGVHPIQAVDNHFNDNLAMRLHKHLGTGKEQLSESDYEVAPVMRNFSGDRTGAPKPVLEVPDGSRQRPEDYMQGLIDKIAVVCRSKAAGFRVLQRAPGVGFAVEVSKSGANLPTYNALQPNQISEVVAAITQLVRAEDAGAVVEQLDSRVTGYDNPLHRQYTAILRVLVRGREDFRGPQYDRRDHIGGQT